MIGLSSQAITGWFTLAGALGGAIIIGIFGAQARKSERDAAEQHRKAEAAERQAEREAERVERWTDDAGTLTVELEGHLERCGVPALFNQPTMVMGAWDMNLRTRPALVLRFAPTDDLRRVGVELLGACDLMHMRAKTLLIRRRDDPSIEDDPSQHHNYPEYHGEAVLALARFVEVLGGPKAPPRDGFTLPLRTDYDARVEDERQPST